MKRVDFLRVITIVFPIISYSQLVDLKQRCVPQKIYVEPSQLMFDNGEIFAQIEGQWRVVNSIYSDPRGYIAVIQTRWICPLCFYNNDERAKTCERWYQDRREYCRCPRPTK